MAIDKFIGESVKSATQLEHERLKFEKAVMQARDNFQYDPQRQISNQGSTILRNIQGDINELRHEMVRLKGFYEWMIHAYPETIAQYKALMDLQRASNELTSPAAEQAYGQSKAKSAI